MKATAPHVAIFPLQVADILLARLCSPGWGSFTTVETAVAGRGAQVYVAVWRTLVVFFFGTRTCARMFRNYAMYVRLRFVRGQGQQSETRKNRGVFVEAGGCCHSWFFAALCSLPYFCFHRPMKEKAIHARSAAALVHKFGIQLWGLR